MAIVMEMRLASINLDSVNLDKLEGVKKVYPLPMPVFAKESSDDLFLVHSLTDRKRWMREASMTTKLDVTKKAKFPLELPRDVFEKHFIPLGSDFQGSGVYGKVPSPVISLKVEVPCSYRSGERHVSVQPDEYVVKTNAGTIKHFSEVDFERLFVSSLDQVRDMKVQLKSSERSHENELSV